MKITRDKNVITLVVEPIDAPPGADLEIVADAIYTGMLEFANNPVIHARMMAATEGDRVLDAEVEKATDDVMERWEIGPNDEAWGGQNTN
jgi:hypothetical protein